MHYEISNSSDWANFKTLTFYILKRQYEMHLDVHCSVTSVVGNYYKLPETTWMLCIYEYLRRIGFPRIAFALIVLFSRCFRMIGLEIVFPIRGNGVLLEQTVSQIETVPANITECIEQHSDRSYRLPSSVILHKSLEDDPPSSLVA